MRNFGFARIAPGCPEIDNRDLSVKVLGCRLSAADVFEGEFRSAFRGCQISGTVSVGTCTAATKQRKELQQLLAERKLKKTSQRALIWASLLESKGHPSVEEIRDNLLAQGHRIGLATIYRTIKILLESGFVRQSKLLGMTRYEPVVNQPNHLHFICNSCGRTV